MNTYHVDINGIVPGGCDDLDQMLSHHMGALRLPAQCDISIRFVDEEEMSALHVEWMNEPGPTDVLSFPMDELTPGCAEPGSLGDIALCTAVAERQAPERNWDTASEIHFLATHGLLHLLGYDHATEEEYQSMFALQDELLSAYARSMTDGQQ
ncbi:MAG: hypothetical protein RJB01_1396 [Actinomycetota bacterium]